MPSSLTKAARKYWRWYADKLHTAGLLQSGDREALATLCELEAAEKQALADIEENGRYLWQEFGNGGAKRVPNPAAKEALELQKEKRQYYTLFGITPSVREKLHLKQPEDDKGSELLKFLNESV
jgi:P27 family predicted phage terminase small subunit